MKLRQLVWLWAAILCSCTAHHSNVANTIPAVGNNLAKTDAHILSADRLVSEAKKGIDKARTVLLNVAGKELDSARDSNDAAQSDLTSVQKERDKLEVQGQKLADDLTKVKAGWGYRLQTLIERFWFWFKTISILALVIHYGFLLASLVVAGPVRPILTTVAAVVNPGAWAMAIVQHIHAKQKESK